MNRWLARYPMTFAFAVLCTWTSAMVWMTEMLR